MKRENQPDLMFCPMTGPQLTLFNHGRTDFLYGAWDPRRYSDHPEGEYYCRGMMYEHAKRLVSWPMAKVYYER